MTCGHNTLPSRLRSVLEKKYHRKKKNSKSENSFEMLILHRSDENETTDTK